MSGAALIALAWWATVTTEPRDPAPEPTRVAEHHAPVARPPFVLAAPAPRPIEQPPSRADGLDRVDPCGPIADEGRAQYRLLGAYVTRRENELGAVLRTRAGDAIGARVRTALGSAGSGSSDAGLGSDSADVRLATAAALASGALRADEQQLALEYARDAIAIAPDDPIGFVLASLAASRSNAALSAAALSRAFALAPHEPDIAMNVLFRLGPTSDVMGALAAADALLDVAPIEEWARSRARIAARAHVFAGGVRRSRGPFTVLGPAAMPEASTEHLLDVASSVLPRVLEVTGCGPRHEIVLSVYPDAETMRTCTCPRSEGDGLVMLLAQLGDAENDARVGDAALRRAVRGSMWLAPNLVMDGALQLAGGPETDADRAAYRALVHRGHWLDPAAFSAGLRSHADAADARLAHAQSRAILEWLIAQRGMPGVHEAGQGSVEALRDPIGHVARIARTPLDEATLLAFVVERLAALD